MIFIKSDLVYSANTFSQVLEGFDWGPCVTKMVIKLDNEVTVGAENGILSESSFSVITTKKGYTNPTETEERSVQKAYTSDEKGNYINKSTNYITLELLCNPEVGNPFFFNFMETFRNEWSVPYTTKITLKNDITLGVTLSSNTFSVNEEPTKNHLIFIDDVFVNNTYSFGGNTLGYAYYKCKNEKNKGLVIWIHGIGEGGNDTTITLYGNKVTALANTTIQNDLNNNCDILVVQCPDYWLDVTKEEKEQFTTASSYTEIFKSLVDKYVSENNIKTDRIYIGGCSMGGYMTMNMILNYPKFFSAAYFAAEAFQDQYISDEQIESIKNIPMWFIHAENDGSVDISNTTNATIERLKKANAPDIHYSYYIDVLDTSRVYDYVNGSQYKYNAHWSWVYLFNDECNDNGETVFTWLSKINNDDSSSNSQFIKNSIFISLLLFAFIF